MGSRYRCRVSPTGVPGCQSEGTGGTGGGTGGEGATGPTGPAGPTGPSSDEPDLEEFATTEDDENVVAGSIAIGEDELIRAGIAWIGSDGTSDVVVHETTFVMKRVGAAAAIEVGAHDNGTVRDEIEAGVAGADSDYVPTATGVDLTVQGVAGTPINWTVQAWFSRYPI